MMNIDEIAQFFNESDDFCGLVKQGEPLAKRTTMRVGGSAALFLEPSDEDSLLLALRTLDANTADYFVLAGGSNVIVSDSGFSGTVISLRALHEVSLSGTTLTAQAGSSWGRVISLCKAQSLLGFEGFAGLPGTVGGALYMNASCFGHAACDNLLSVRYYEAGAVHTYTPSSDRSCDWGYKRSPFQPHGTAKSARRVILSATFACTLGSDQTAVRARYDETLRARTAKGHFTKPSAGSTFKNPVGGSPAGKLIDDCGLKGFAIGGAQIAPWHGNIVINADGATAKDIAELVKHVQAVVKKNTDVTLEPEVIFCGDEA